MPYLTLRASSVFLFLYSFTIAVSFELAFTPLGYASALASTAFILAFGVLARKSFDQMAEEFSLAVKVFPVLVIGQAIFLVSYLMEAKGYFSILGYVGEIMVLAYLLEFALEVLRLSNHLNSRELKASSYLILASLVAAVIVGYLIFGILLTIATLFLFYGLSNVISRGSAQ